MTKLLIDGIEVDVPAEYTLLPALCHRSHSAAIMRTGSLCGLAA